MTARSASQIMARITRDVLVAVEARETYEARMRQLRREGKFTAARRLKRASLAELLNPDTPDYGGSREP